VKDQFFVNGIAIERTSRKTKGLTPTKQKKTTGDEETLKYSNQPRAEGREQTDSDWRFYEP